MKTPIESSENKEAHCKNCVKRMRKRLLFYEPVSEFFATSFFGNGTKVNAMCWPTKVAFLIFFEVHGIFKLRPDLSTWLGV